MSGNPWQADNVRAKLGAFAAGVVECGWLAALLAVPAFFSLYTAQSFEEQKILLLRSLAALMLAGAIVWRVAAGATAWRVGERSIWHLPLVLPVMVLTGAHLVSTALSVAPRVSMWGWYLRNQGTYTWLSYVMIFLASLALAGERPCRARVVRAILLASLAPALYGVMQHFGLDPIQWNAATIPWNRAGFSTRVHGTAGHPLFLSAFIVMVVPLTVVHALERCCGGGPAAGPAGGRGRTVRLLYATPYLGLLIVQLLAIAYSQSRGPVVGLAFGLLCFVLLLAGLQRVRWPLFGAGALAVAVVVAIVAGRSWRAPLSQPEAVRWLEASGDFEAGSGRTRTLFWQGAADLVGADALRAVIGYGPETFVLMYHRVYPPELARAERANIAPDRAHNETFDALVTTGIVGCAAELTVFLALFYHVLRWLGVLATPSQRSGFMLAVTGGGIIGAVAPYCITGSVEFSGLGLPLGMAAGLMIYLTVRVLALPPPEVTLPGRDHRLLAALCAGVMAHFVEIQVGIAVGVTRLYFFTYASLVVAIGTQLHAQAEGAEKAVRGSATPRHARRTARPSQAVWLGAAVALLLIVLSFDFDLPTAFREHAAPLAGFGLIVWLFGATLLAQTNAPGPPAARPLVHRGLTYLAASTMPWLLVVSLFAAWNTWAPARGAGPSAVPRMGLQLAGNLSLVYAAISLWVLCGAAVIARERRSAGTRAGTRLGWLAAVAVTLMAVGIVVANLERARADCFTKLGGVFERQGRVSEALRAYEEALRRRPWQQEYATNLTRVLIDKMRQLDGGDLRARDADAVRASGLMEAAGHANVLDPDPLINLARVYREWARFDHSADRFTRAAAAYAQALALKPNDAALWNELGTLYLESRQVERALSTFDHSLAADPQVPATYVLRAQACADAGRFQEAETECDRALALSPDLLAAWAGKAVALTRLNREGEAKLAAGRAARLIPRDAATRREVIARLQEVGMLGLVRAHARAILTLVGPDERARLQEFITPTEAP